MVALTSPISFDRPEWLLLALLAPVLAAISRRALGGLEPSRRRATLALRTAVIVVLAAALARVECVRRHDGVAVMFVLDRSRSIPDERRKAAEDYIRAVVRDARGDDRVGVIAFDTAAQVDLMPSRVGFEITGFGMPEAPDRTDIGAGLRMAMAAFPEGFARRIVLLSDGNENLGRLTDELDAAAANGIVVDVVPLRYRYDNEIVFDRLVAPAQADRQTRVPLRMVLRSRRPTRARLTVYHNGTEIPLADPFVDLSGDMKPDPVTLPVELTEGGVHRFDARIAPVDQAADAIADNNRATAFTFVEDRGRVLILSAAGSTDDRVLAEALRRERVDVDLTTVDRFALDLLQLQEYGAVILANVPADAFTAEQHRALASYVRDFGGGLIMTGGNEAFGAGGWIGMPIEEVSPVRFEIRHKKQMPRGALAIVMHSCEIPRGNYWGEEVAIASVRAISSLDYLGVIAYSFSKGGANWEVPLAPATDKQAVIRRIRGMEIGDMPDFATTMSIAVRDLMALPDAAQRHMIIISDGDPAPPSEATLDEMVANRITCSTVGIGYGSHVLEEPLRRIARRTGGRFYPVKNPSRLPQIFVKEARVVKRALISERPFQPRMSVGFPEITAGISPGELPTLGGLVLTERKDEALVPIVRESLDAGERMSDPVLACRNFEMGKMAVFTSGWWPRWGGAWAGWDKFGKLWAQLVRWAMRQEGSGDFDVITRLEGSRGHIVIEALNKEAGYLNFLQIRGKLMTPSMERLPLELHQTGPGRYEGSFDVTEQGNYLANLQYSDGRGESGLIRTGLSMAYSPEFRDLGANEPLLREAAARTGGRVLAMDPATDDVFNRNLPPSVSRRPAWRWLVQWVLLPLFVLDVAVRRLAALPALSLYVEATVLVIGWAGVHAAGGGFWGYLGVLVLAETIGWTVRRASIGPTLAYLTAGVAGVAGAGRRSAAALSRLKGVRERVREDMETQRQGTESAPAEPATPAPMVDRTRRFDLGEAPAGEPSGDLTDALGGARAETSLDRGPDKDAGPGEGSLADRLRRAKRRAQDEMRDRGEGKG